MNAASKFGLLATGLGLAMSAPNAQALVVEHGFSGNAVNFCQAFTPGLANTIRNRVVGSENVGTATVNVACAFHSVYGDANTSYPRSLDIYFSNDNASGTLTVTCTLLTGYQNQGGTSQYAVTKTTAPISPGIQSHLLWDATDNPSVGATDLANWLVGVNCSMPPGAVINDTYLDWQQDNGV